MKIIPESSLTKINALYLQYYGLNTLLSEHQLINLLHAYAKILDYPLSRSQVLSIANAQSKLKLTNPSKYAYMISTDLAQLNKITEDELRKIIGKYR